MKVDNAVILAAGTSSRFAPLSYETHKALIEVKGEILIEREIRQLQEVGIKDIYIVTGYKAEQFEYLQDKFNVKLIHNPEYKTRNNNGSIWAVRNVLKNTYICSSDNYFSINPFENSVEHSFYSAVYAAGYTNEWCITENKGFISNVSIGGYDSWYMLGHVFWDENFSKKFISILKAEYNKPETKNKLWESIYIDHIKELPLKMRKYAEGVINEFDTLDELRLFDQTYTGDTRSQIIKQIAKDLNTKESDIVDITTIKGNNAMAIGFSFKCDNSTYHYFYDSKTLERQP